MINERLENIRRAMTEAGLDGLLVTSRENVFYLSGFSGTNGDLFITHDAAYIMTDFRYLIQAAEEAPLYTLKDTKAGIYGLVNELIFAHRVMRLGIEDRLLSYAAYKGMKGSLNNTVIIGVGDLISSTRTVKDPDEFSALRTAARIADDAFSATVKLMKCGMTELEVAAEIEYQMRKKCSKGTSFDTIVASGVNSAKPHGTATSKTLDTGDLVVMDFGCIYNGYCSDMTRTVAMGEISGEQKAVYNAVLYTQLKALNFVKPGVACSDADEYARKILDNFGYGEFFGHSLGHGVGIEIHEEPALSSKSKKTLSSGMVFTVEPGVYIDNKFGVRIEDTVIITENSMEILTNSTKELIII